MWAGKMLTKTVKETIWVRLWKIIDPDRDRHLGAPARCKNCGRIRHDMIGDICASCDAMLW